MRPRELTVRGFRSFRESATFDFRERHLVGVVGPIGSGKSSILDAVAFALYGKTPAVERDTRSLIHQLCTECHVELRFEVDGQVWRAVRSLRAKGASGHQLERLAADEPDAEVMERVTGERAVTGRVEQLLGMDFDAFCRSVLLAQNRFSDFLKARPGERDKVLKGVFGYERLDEAQQVARARLQAVELELDALAKERRHIEEAREQLDAARTVASDTRRRVEQLESAAPDVERIGKERDGALKDAAGAAARVATLEELVKALPSQEEVDDAVSRAAGAAELVAGSRATLEAAETARADREAELADVVSRLGDREKFRSFEALVGAFERQTAEAERVQEAFTRAEGALAAAGERLTQLRADASAAAAAFAQAEESRTAAAGAVADARTSLMAATHADMARELRGALVAGEACPVCDQPVHAVPRMRAVPGVAAAKRALAKAEKAESRSAAEQQRWAVAEAEARAASEAASEMVTAAEAGLAQAEGVVRTMDADLAATRGQLTEWLGEEGDARSSFEARESELAHAEGALSDAKVAMEAARSTVDRAKDEAKRAETSLARIANRLSSAWGRLGEDREMATEHEAIAAAFVELCDTVIGRHAEAVAKGEDAAARQAAASGTLREILEGLGLSPDLDFAHELSAAGVEHGAAAQVVRTLEERIERSGTLERTMLAAEGRRGLAQRLAEDLKPSRFLAFLLEEERAQLADLGSEHFEELTDGNYRFTRDGGFDVLDLNAAGAVRKADSLSGGETFLASLALALGLAEMVARSGGRLDAFFLDEGFGSLDPEHLDRAMDGIGRLVAGDAGRLVVVVSHVAEMREAIEDLVVLDKHGVTGDTLVLSGAAAV